MLFSEISFQYAKLYMDIKYLLWPNCIIYNSWNLRREKLIKAMYAKIVILIKPLPKADQNGAREI